MDFHLKWPKIMTHIKFKFINSQHLSLFIETTHKKTSIWLHSIKAYYRYINISFSFPLSTKSVCIPNRYSHKYHIFLHYLYCITIECRTKVWTIIVNSVNTTEEYLFLEIRHRKERGNERDTLCQNHLFTFFSNILKYLLPMTNINFNFEPYFLCNKIKIIRNTNPPW